MRKLIACIPILFSILITAQTNRAFLDSRGQLVYINLGDQAFADRVASYQNGNPPATGMYAQTDACLGKPDFQHWQKAGSLSLGCGGELVVEFTDNALVNMPGNDLYIFETGPAIEPTTVSISENGYDWLQIGTIKGGAAFLDLEGIINENSLYYFVKLKDLRSDCNNNGVDGADIDAIAALGSVPTKGLCAQIKQCAQPSIDKWKRRKPLEVHDNHKSRLLDSLAIIESIYLSECTYAFANNIFNPKNYKFSFDKSKQQGTLFFKHFEPYHFNVDAKNAKIIEQYPEKIVFNNPEFGINCTSDKAYINALDINYPDVEITQTVKPVVQQQSQIMPVQKPMPEVEVKQSFNIKNHQIEIDVWDNGQEDGDTISVYLNNQILLDNYAISNKKHSLTIDLPEGTNQLILVAENLGEIPPNTAAFKIKDGRKLRMVVLNSDYAKSEAIILER